MAKDTSEPLNMSEEPVELVRAQIFEDATTKIQQVYDDLKMEVNTFQRERSHFMEISKKLEGVHFPDIIKLNVGGTTYQTTMQTLKKDPNSMLAAMFSGRFALSKDESGAYFINRDGKLFRHVLNFLRTGQLQDGKLPQIRDALLTEAKFYQIQSLMEMLIDPPLVVYLKNSKIMEEDFKKHFEDWLPKDQFKWKFIYSGEKDGWAAADFHRCCDAKSPTIFLAQSRSTGYIFGGYTDQPWIGEYFYSCYHLTGKKPSTELFVQ